MSISIIKTEIDTSKIERGIEIANELIEKINAANVLAKELSDIVVDIDFKMTFSPEIQEDFESESSS